MEKKTTATRPALNRALTAVLALVILGTIVYFFYTITVPQPKEPFTEFYILGLGGRAGDYPSQLKVGETWTLTLGIINQEHETVTYQVKIKMDGVTTGRLKPIVLKPSEKYEQLVTFTPDEPGDKQKVEFLLFKQGQSEIYRSLHLWVNVKMED